MRPPRPPPPGLRARVARELTTVDDESMAVIVEHLARRHGDAIAAVLFYGSCLTAETRSPTSFHDFYALTDRPGRFYDNLLHVALSAVLPPNTYFGTAPGPQGAPLRYKVCVLSIGQFQRQTSAHADDIHHLGRFSKRFAIPHSRDDATTEAIVDGALCAMRTLVPHTLARLPARFGLDEFIRAQLGLSYAGESRVAEPTKIDRLFAAAAPYYREIYPQVLAWHADDGVALRCLDDGSYQQAPPSPAARRRTERFLRRSRVRGLLRWPKYLLTVDGWLEIELDKLERYHGIALQLTDRERRHPLIFGWPKFFSLLRQGIIR